MVFIVLVLIGSPSFFSASFFFFPLDIFLILIDPILPVIPVPQLPLLLLRLHAVFFVFVKLVSFRPATVVKSPTPTTRLPSISSSPFPDDVIASTLLLLLLLPPPPRRRSSPPCRTTLPPAGRRGGDSLRRVDATARAVVGEYSVGDVVQAGAIGVLRFVDPLRNKREREHEQFSPWWCTSRH